jgi:hypothetical protein
MDLVRGRMVRILGAEGPEKVGGSLQRHVGDGDVDGEEEGKRDQGHVFPYRQLGQRETTSYEQQRASDGCGAGMESSEQPWVVELCMSY